MPMGIKTSPDTAQEIMESIFHNMDDVSIYLDDTSLWNDSFDEHLASLEQVLQHLQDNNFCVNPLKCEWCVKETDFLGYWMTPKGLRPWKKKN